MFCYQHLKKVIYITVCTVLGLSFVHTAAAQDRYQTVEPGVLTIGSDLTYPPYLYLEGDQPTGFDPDFMRALAAQMDLEPRFVDTRFAQLITGLKANRFDVVASILYITPERAEVIDYVPYMQTGDSLIVLQDSELAPKVPEDLCGQRVSSIKGASWIPKLAKVSREHCEPNGESDIDVREFATAPGATQALLARAVDVQFADAAVAKLAVEKSGERLKITSEELLFPIPVGLGVPENDQAIKAALENAITAMQESGAYQELLDRYNLAAPSDEQVKAALGDQD